MASAISIEGGDNPTVARFNDNISPTPNSSSPMLNRDEYTSEEVTEIIRVALKIDDSKDHTTVSHDEMLSIAKEFGLSESELVHASEEILFNKQGNERAAKAMVAFKINVIGYGVGILGLFLMNLVTSPSVWWFQFPVVAYFPVLVAHGLMVKLNPNLAYELLSEEFEEEDSP